MLVSHLAVVLVTGVSHVMGALVAFLRINTKILLVLQEMSARHVLLHVPVLLQ